MDLEKRFLTLMGSHPNAALYWSEIYANYSNKSRYYHNLNHLQEIFSYYDLYRKEIQHTRAFEFAIFYHDIIYTIFNRNNEEKSAAFALERITELSEESQLVHRYIMATKSHEGCSYDEKLLIDFDIAILGSNSDTYKMYAQNIRMEYDLVPMFLYNKGRIKVLEHFLQKKFIYQTASFREQYENIARKNLLTELNYLKNGS